MTDATYAMLRRAILERKQVTCVFRGLHRELCPHVLGLNKSGQPQVLSFQFAGQSSKGLPTGGEWRCMPVSEMRNVNIRDGDWHTGKSHLRPQTCVKKIDEEVDD